MGEHHFIEPDADALALDTARKTINVSVSSRAHRKLVASARHNNRSVAAEARTLIEVGLGLSKWAIEQSSRPPCHR